MTIITALLKRLARWVPGLKDKLLVARIKEKPEQFIKRVLILSSISSLVLAFFVIGPLLMAFGKGMTVAFIAFPLLFVLLYMYFMKLPDMNIAKYKREISKELVFAIRFLIIDLQSGTLIYSAFENISNNYPVTGYYFRKILDKINYGVSMEEALNWAVEISPSDSLRLVLVQIQNAMTTGSDVVSALNTIVEQLTKEQNIMLDDYAKKLNPIAMFYMIVAVIFPSIGFMMIIIISSFIGFEIDLTVLLIIVAAVSFFQFMFVSMIKSMRPPVEM